MAVTRTVLVEPGGGIPHAAFGLNALVKIQGEHTSGAFSIVEFTCPPGFFAPPHLHERTSEVSYVLEGELGAMVGDEELQARPGAFVVRPKGIPHALWNNSDRTLRLLDMYTPAGFETFGEELAKRYSSTPPSFEQLAELGRQHDVFFLPELAPRLVQKYGLRMHG